MNTYCKDLGPCSQIILKTISCLFPQLANQDLESSGFALSIVIVAKCDKNICGPRFFHLAKVCDDNFFSCNSNSTY